MDKEQRLLPSVLRTAGAREAITETASKLADKTRGSQRKGKKTWTDATRL